MFGGQRSTSYSNSTWAWTGSNWQQLTPQTVPGAREGASMAWDPTTSQLVMFGGRQTGSNADFNDTWVWSGTNWVQQHPATSPPARNSAAMVFDPATGQMLLAGGLFTIGVQVVNDVWTWSGSTWTKQTPARALPPRAGAVAGYDVPTDQLLVFGGDDEASGRRAPLGERSCQQQPARVRSRRQWRRGAAPEDHRAEYRAHLTCGAGARQPGSAVGVKPLWPVGDRIRQCAAVR
jgi:hypothetical protein